jgi:murein L,D-transpeptidase YcbB/YkuD
MQFAWFTSQGLTEQASGFWNLREKIGNHRVEPGLKKKMDSLLNKSEFVNNSYDSTLTATEIQLTDVYLRFFRDNREKLQFAHMSPEAVIPVKKEDPLVIADSILRSDFDTSFANPAHSQFLLLRRELFYYDSIAKQGGMQYLPVIARQFKKGMTAAQVKMLKKRLQQSGDMPEGDSSKKFNDTLERAIKTYQQRMGMKSTGVVTDTMIRQLNMSGSQAVEMIIINMNRMLWMPAKEDPERIMVNIPDMRLQVIESNKTVFEMPVAVGRDGMNTTIFSGMIDQIVFNPYWNIPASIVKNEIMPSIANDPSYLKKNRMEITGENDSIPVIRQLPGNANSLGKVKFLFPNRYDIYLHDTPAKSIFNKDNRAVTHGCIRVADAEKLAAYLLKDSKEWSTQKIRTTMNSKEEQYVRPSKKMPIYVTYLTAQVNDKGELKFKDDIYGHDRRMAALLFTRQSG